MCHWNRYRSQILVLYKMLREILGLKSQILIKIIIHLLINSSLLYILRGSCGLTLSDYIKSIEQFKYAIDFANG